MKRSKINSEIRHMEEMIQAHGFELPPFCRWSAEGWESKGAEYNEIRDNMLGWDITDYGLGRFDEVGFSLITLRNGNLKIDKYTKTYAEKLLLVKEGQMAPMHFHWNKMEDIINRGGGNVLITVYNSTEDGGFADTDVTVNCDGREFTVPAGTKVRLAPGESITIYPYMYHDFHVEEGSGDVAQSLEDLRIPPANHLEKSEGNREGQYSIRINDQYRICFKPDGNNFYDVEITDYH